jgi:hypothetical protein
MLRISILIFIFLLLIFWQIPGGAMGERPDYKSQIKEKFKTIDLSDGVSKEEAAIIAQNFLIDDGFELKDVNILKPQVVESGLIEGCWAVTFNTSFKIKHSQGLNWYTVDIDKKTGEIKAKGFGPS